VDDLTVTEVELDAGASPPPPPSDGRAFDSLYVLDGAVALRTDGREEQAGAGTWIQLRADAPYRLTADGPARCLHVRT
jgi:quercetin dioxygenase-like cupin family protein